MVKDIINWRTKSYNLAAIRAFDFLLNVITSPLYLTQCIRWHNTPPPQPSSCTLQSSSNVALPCMEPCIRVSVTVVVSRRNKVWDRRRCGPTAQDRHTCLASLLEGALEKCIHLHPLYWILWLMKHCCNSKLQSALFSFSHSRTMHQRDKEWRVHRGWLVVDYQQKDMLWVWSLMRSERKEGMGYYH